MPIRCKVPQGSIIGPLLCLIYVNDIYKSWDGNNVSFADDTTLYKLWLGPTFLWFRANKLPLNANKTKYFVIKPKHKNVTWMDEAYLLTIYRYIELATIVMKRLRSF